MKIPDIELSFRSWVIGAQVLPTKMPCDLNSNRLLRRIQRPLVPTLHDRAKY
jgi:hypothetical protein